MLPGHGKAKASAFRTILRSPDAAFPASLSGVLRIVAEVLTSAAANAYSSRKRLPTFLHIHSIGRKELTALCALLTCFEQFIFLSFRRYECISMLLYHEDEHVS